MQLFRFVYIHSKVIFFVALRKVESFFIYKFILFDRKLWHLKMHLIALLKSLLKKNIVMEVSFKTDLKMFCAKTRSISLSSFTHLTVKQA